MSAVAAFDALRAYKREVIGDPLARLTQEDVDAFNAATVGRWNPLKAAPQPATAGLTAKVALELIGHEAIVQEAYVDSVKVWTWGVGVTNASGHDVGRYKDNPQTIDRCLEIYIWLLREKYIPAVEKAFAGHPLTEAQFAAALSFHYNTGAIKTATWVESWLAGDVAKAKLEIMNWCKPPEIKGRRTKERDLFFDGKWSSDGKATVYPVRKPSYTPNWGAAKRVDVSAILKGLLA